MQDGDAVVLVEGDSDRVAVETLAMRLGRDLGADGVRVVSMGGATNIGAFLAQFGPRGEDARIAGLCDAGEERLVRRALAAACVGGAGFFVCHADLEDELIRSLGIAGTEAVIEREGELRSLRRFQRQAAQRERTAQAQLRRFMGTRSGRKSRYARVLVEALDLTRVPRPLDRLLAYV